MPVSSRQRLVSGVALVVVLATAVKNASTVAAPTPSFSGHKGVPCCARLVL